MLLPKERDEAPFFQLQRTGALMFSPHSTFECLVNTDIRPSHMTSHLQLAGDILSSQIAQPTK